MTAEEMKYQFEVGLDTISSHTSPGYVDEEIDIFLNRAQDIVVEEAYKNRKLKDLKEITIWSGSLNVVSNSNLINCYYATIPTSNRFLYYVNALTNISRSTVKPFTTSWIPAELIDPLDADKYIQSNINRPIFLNPKIWTETNSGTEYFNIIVDPYTTMGATETFKIQYVKRPVRIFQGSYDWDDYWSQDGTDPTTAQDCELSLDIHSKIVDKAVEIARVVEDPNEAQAYVPLTQHVTKENDNSGTTSRV